MDHCWHSSFASLLDKSIIDSEAKISQLSRANYAPLLSSVQALSLLREDSRAMSSRVSELNRALSRSGDSLLAASQELQRAKLVRMQLNQTICVLETTANLLEASSHATEQVAANRFYSALRNLGDLSSRGLPPLQAFAAERLLHPCLSSLSNLVKYRVKQHFINWLGGVRLSHRPVGATSMEIIARAYFVQERVRATLRQARFEAYMTGLPVSTAETAALLRIAPAVSTILSSVAESIHHLGSLQMVTPTAPPPSRAIAGTTTSSVSSTSTSTSVSIGRTASTSTTTSARIRTKGSAPPEVIAPSGRVRPSAIANGTATAPSLNRSADFDSKTELKRSRNISSSASVSSSSSNSSSSLGPMGNNTSGVASGSQSPTWPVSPSSASSSSLSDAIDGSLSAISASNTTGLDQIFSDRVDGLAFAPELGVCPPALFDLLPLDASTAAFAGLFGGGNVMPREDCFAMAPFPASFSPSVSDWSGSSTNLGSNTNINTSVGTGKSTSPKTQRQQGQGKTGASINSNVSGTSPFSSTSSSSNGGGNTNTTNARLKFTSCLRIAAQGIPQLTSSSTSATISASTSALSSLTLSSPAVTTSTSSRSGNSTSGRSSTSTSASATASSSSATEEQDGSTIISPIAGRGPLALALGIDALEILHGLNFGALHQCLHIFSAVGQEARFGFTYRERRNAQALQVAEAAASCSLSVFLWELAHFLADLAGYFSVERHVMRHASAVVNASQFEAAWAGAGGISHRLRAVLLRQLTSVTSPPMLLEAKALVMIFSRIIESLGLSTLPLLEIFTSFSESLSSLLLTQFRMAVSQALRTVYSPPPSSPNLSTTSISSFTVVEEEDLSQYAYGYGYGYGYGDAVDAANAVEIKNFVVRSQHSFNTDVGFYGLGPERSALLTFPLPLPFTAAVPEVAKLVQKLVHQSLDFHSGLPGPNGITDTLRVAENALMEVSVIISALLARSGVEAEGEPLAKLASVTAFCVDCYHLVQVCRFTSCYIQAYTGAVLPTASASASTASSSVGKSNDSSSSSSSSFLSSSSSSASNTTSFQLNARHSFAQLGAVCEDTAFEIIYTQVDSLLETLVSQPWALTELPTGPSTAMVSTAKFLKAALRLTQRCSDPVRESLVYATLRHTVMTYTNNLVNAHHGKKMNQLGYVVVKYDCLILAQVLEYCQSELLHHGSEGTLDDILAELEFICDSFLGGAVFKDSFKLSVMNPVKFLKLLEKLREVEPGLLPTPQLVLKNPVGILSRPGLKSNKPAVTRGLHHKGVSDNIFVETLYMSKKDIDAAISKVKQML